MRLENVTSKETEYTKQEKKRLQPYSAVIEFESKASLDVENVLYEIDLGSRSMSMNTVRDYF